MLSWTHYRCLIQVKDEEARSWYEKEAYEQTWSVRTLQRNINTQYYYRILQSQNKEIVEKEMQEKTADFQNDKLEFIKNPVIAEFFRFIYKHGSYRNRIGNQYYFQYLFKNF